MLGPHISFSLCLSLKPKQTHQYYRLPYKSHSECLHVCQFEEPYQALLLGMQCFDFMQDGHIARVDFQKVLAEFGFSVGAMDLEYFMSRWGCIIFMRPAIINLAL